jgi:hypothetical protein
LPLAVRTKPTELDGLAKVLLSQGAGT